MVVGLVVVVVVVRRKVGGVADVAGGPAAVVEVVDGVTTSLNTLVFDGGEWSDERRFSSSSRTSTMARTRSNQANHRLCGGPSSGRLDIERTMAQALRVPSVGVAPRYVRSESALWHRTSGRTLVSPGPGRDIIELTGVTALVWDVLGEPVSVPDLAADLAAVFDRDAGAVAPEVEGLLAELVAVGAARPVPS